MLLPLVMVPTDDRWGFPSVAQFALAESRLSSPLRTETAAHTLVLRYLAAFGPATVADFQTWSGLSGAKAVFADLRPQLRGLRDERKRELFDIPDGPLPDADAAEAPIPPRFLPEFDQLVLAHADRSRFIDDADRARIVTKNLRVRATFLWDGRVAGTWEIVRKKAIATLQIAPFRALPEMATAGLATEGEALLRFVEPDAEMYQIAWFSREA